jgi:hypothetical protein
MTLMPLPAPKEGTSTVLRTDFSNDAAWSAVQAAIDTADDHPHATYVSDPRFTDVSVQALIDEQVAAEEDDKLAYVFLADATTMTDPSSPLLAVDLQEEPGQTFRVAAEWFPEVSGNLYIANMNFSDFAKDADNSGTWHGW